MSGTEESKDYCAVGLGVAGHALDPSLITDATGLTPTQAWKRGHKYFLRSGQEVEKHRGLWALEFEGERVADVALKLVAAVEPHIQQIQAIARDVEAEISVSIWWEPAGGQHGFDLDSSLLSRLAALGSRVSVYFPGTQDEE